ncbi:MAG: hypothetical protein ACR2HG_11210 [Pyrinomonadaceae bacterium]
MKKKSLISLAVFIILTGICSTVSAQFNIKIPKINKPKTEKPKTDEPKTNDGNSSTERNTNANQNSSIKSKDAVGFMPKPQPTNVPVLLRDSVNIKVYTGNKYWKAPNGANHSSWIPLIQFGLFYDESETIHYKVEWLNPDGSLWFSEPIDDRQTRMTSEVFDTKSTDAAGTYGVRLVNAKTKDVVFQGKFKVGKIPGDINESRYKNVAMFYVENDWSLPIGYVGFDEHDSWDYDPSPTVYMWFKGDLKREDFEARLFYNNQQVASTDDGGIINDGSTFPEQRNDDSCFDHKEVCRYILWSFKWKKFRVESFDWEQHPNNQSYVRSESNAVYTKDKPGEYTVKIFYKGQQVRETKFTVQPNGYLAPNAYASQVPLDRLKAIITVRIMGTLDKYNAAVWKTDAFYGNPLNGFIAP